MKHTRIIRFLGVYLALSVIRLFCLTSISAETDYPEQPQVSTQPEISVNDSAVASARSSVSPEIVSGAIYALLNTGTNKWASTAHTASTVDSLNVFQYSQWSNSAQTFRFVKVSPTDNTYVIYPLEYNGRNQNANYTKALWCDCSAMASNPQTINVTLADYNSSDDGFKWTIEYVTMGFIIRLKNYPNYCLFPVDNTVGSPTATGISDNGNIVVRYVSPAQLIPSSYSIWELKYVIPNGTYYIKNRGEGSYLHANNYAGGKVLLKDYSGATLQKWSISHISNGRYFITSTGSAGAMALASRTPVDGDFVYVEGNMAQPRFWWNIERTASGSFKIQCATAEDYEYALKDGETIAGHHYVANGEYWDDLDYSDEWYIYGKVFGLVHYYDKTIKRNNTLLNYIDDASDFAVDVYSNLLANYGITIEPVGVPQYYEDVTGEKAMADQCTLPSQTPCQNNDDTCGSWCRMEHEKNPYNMSSQLINDTRNENYIYVMWGNRPYGTYCDTDLWAEDSEHTLLSNTIAWVTGYEDDSTQSHPTFFPVINFLTIDQPTNNQKLACMSIILVHELAHTFQMEDVYDSPGHDENRKFVCVMEKYENNTGISEPVDWSFYSNIIAGQTSAFCPSCLNTLIPLIQSCYHDATP